MGRDMCTWESYVMLTGYNYLFARSEPEGYIVKEDNLRAYKFKSKKFGQDIVAINAVNGTEPITLDLGAQEIRYFDEYANETN